MRSEHGLFDPWPEGIAARVDNVVDLDRLDVLPRRPARPRRGRGGGPLADLPTPAINKGGGGRSGGAMAAIPVDRPPVELIA